MKKIYEKVDQKIVLVKAIYPAFLVTQIIR